MDRRSCAKRALPWEAWACSSLAGVKVSQMAARALRLRGSQVGGRADEDRPVSDRSGGAGSAHGVLDARAAGARAYAVPLSTPEPARSPPVTLPGTVDPGPRPRTSPTPVPWLVAAPVLDYRPTGSPLLSVGTHHPHQGRLPVPLRPPHPERRCRMGMGRPVTTRFMTIVDGNWFTSGRVAGLSSKSRW